MWFRRLGVVTIVTVYLLILAGGIVRSTGSGMGCPDWPRCFGSWVPPTSISQLPPNYQELYGAKLKGEVVFNALKTWIEYVNRLLGALTGVLIFATLIASVPFLKKDKPVFYLSLLAFIMVGFQGWLGSKVVSSELHPVMVTFHMIVAILIVF
ncbi:MAG: COX15/CtaA family protein, partial [Cytophagaceae bacterium]|nr:COX15/CtaA family protein [Cytophagaceae bacterium]